MHGFINLNKPEGITSFDVIRIIRPRLPRKHKIGHLGTLDPMAAGVLPLALGRASRLINYIDDREKEYIATMTLGVVSDTQDAWGRLEETGCKTLSTPDLNAVVSSFTGIIKQIPPMYSAVHHQGRRLYELAREGLTVERPEREVMIRKIEILSIDESPDLPRIVLRVACSGGTYIRTLCHDIGEKLGTGAVMSRLLRTRSGPFGIEESVNLDEIKSGGRDLQEVLLPIDYPLAGCPSLALPEGTEGCWENGRAIAVDASSPEGCVKVYDQRGEFRGMALIEGANGQKILRPRRVIDIENGV